jgi:type I restriction enzyme M protein
VEADLVDCIVALPDKLFFNTGIPVSLWFLSRNRHGNGHRKRDGEVLFIDARQLGAMSTRRLRRLSDDDVQKIAETYHAWRNHDGGFAESAGFARAASLDEIARHDFVLSPGRYVGTEAIEDDAEPIDEKIARLSTELFAEFERSRALEDRVRNRMRGLDR